MRYPGALFGCATKNPSQVEVCFMIRIVPGLALAATLLLSAGQNSFAQTAPAQIVKERQDAMEKNWTDYYRDISRTLRTDSPDLALVAAKSAGASEHLKKLGQLFPPGTGRDVVPTTRAKPDVWTQRADFEAAMKALIDSTNAMGDAAKSGNVEKVKAEWQVVTKACGGCHGGPEKSGGKFRFEKE
jgi:cytochrome c556